MSRTILASRELHFGSKSEWVNQRDSYCLLKSIGVRKLLRFYKGNKEPWLIQSWVNKG